MLTRLQLIFHTFFGGSSHGRFPTALFNPFRFNGLTQVEPVLTAFEGALPTPPQILSPSPSLTSRFRSPPHPPFMPYARSRNIVGGLDRPRPVVHATPGAGLRATSVRSLSVAELGDRVRRNSPPPLRSRNLQIGYFACWHLAAHAALSKRVRRLPASGERNMSGVRSRSGSNVKRVTLFFVPSEFI